MIVNKIIKLFQSRNRSKGLRKEDSGRITSNKIIIRLSKIIIRMGNQIKIKIMQTIILDGTSPIIITMGPISPVRITHGARIVTTDGDSLIIRIIKITSRTLSGIDHFILM